MASMRAAILFGRCSRPPSKQGAPPMKDEATPSAPRVGDIFTVVYPFVREEVSLFGEDGPYESVKWRPGARSEEHTSELQSLMRSSYAVFCLKNTTTT